jgi:hypothetical protein
LITIIDVAILGKGWGHRKVSVRLYLSEAAIWQ